MARIKEIAYRLKLRKMLGQASIEELIITKEEVSKEIDKRKKKNGRTTI